MSSSKPATTKLEWSNDHILWNYYHAQNDTNQSENSEERRNLNHTTIDEPTKVGSNLHESEEFHDKLEVSLHKINNPAMITFKFNDLIKNTKIISNKMNMYCVSTTVDTVRKMNGKQWCTVKEMYEKLKSQEITNNELYTLVHTILRDIYGENEVIKILHQYDKHIDKAVLIFGVYLLSRYNETFAISTKSVSDMKSLQNDRCLVPNRKPNILNKEKSMKIGCKEIEKKKTISATKRKCYACNVLSNKKWNSTNNLRQINPDIPIFCTPPNNRNANYFKSNITGTKTEPLKNKKTNIDTTEENTTTNKIVNDPFSLDQNLVSHSEGDGQLNDSYLITGDSSEEVVTTESSSCLPNVKEKSEDLLSLLMKNKGSDKKTRSNLTIRLEKDVLSEALDNGNKINRLQQYSSMAISKLKSFTKYIPEAIRRILPNLILLIILTLCKNQLDHTNLYYAATNWFKNKIRNVLIGALRCVEKC